MALPYSVIKLQKRGIIMIFVISNCFDNLKNEGSFFWGENYFPSIRKFLPENIVDVISITEAILYFNKSDQKEKPPLKLKISHTHITKVYLKINYKIVSEIDEKSFKIRNTLKQYFNKTSLLDLPFCCAVDEEKFYSILNLEDLSFELDSLIQKKDWSTVKKLLDKYQPLEKSALWNNSQQLNKFSFATAKLSECTENLIRKFPDKEKRKEFIKEKKYFRELTIKLRERCIELSPDNPSFYSNLAYSFYQSVNELNTPNGRRDGNIVSDAEKAIKFIDNALAIDNNRITDLYRKAILLSEILPDHILYKSDSVVDDSSKNSINDKYNNCFDLISKGLNEFIKLVNIYEEIVKKTNNESESIEIAKRYKKYYIKSLYHIAQKKLRIIKMNFNSLNLLYGSKVIEISTKDTDEAIRILNEAKFYIDKCIQSDFSKKHPVKEFIDLVESDNNVLSVYKAYLKAVIEFYLYIVTDEKKHLHTAKDFFNKAMDVNFPPAQRNQNKLFILEKIALLNLIEGKYDSALKILEPLYKKSISNNKFKIPYYAAHTLAITYILIKANDSAKTLIDEFSKCGNKIFEHKFRKLSEFLKNSVSKKIEIHRNQ